MTRTVEATAHAVLRAMVRSNCPFVTAERLESAFYSGLEAEVVGKQYDEARLVDCGGRHLVALRRGQDVVTLVKPFGHTIRFVEARPTFECRNCRHKEPNVDHLPKQCEVCGRRRWERIDPDL